MQCILHGDGHTARWIPRAGSHLPGGTDRTIQNELDPNELDPELDLMASGLGEALAHMAAGGGGWQQEPVRRAVREE
jgi:hypothetical protein